MLELAIAEAYRPRPQLRSAPPAPPRPAAFATNPNARLSTPSLSSRLPSLPSQSSSLTSRSLSLRSIIRRRKRPDSVLSDRTFKPDDTDASRSTSIPSPAAASSVTHVASSSSKTTPATALAPPCTVRTDKKHPVLPPPVPLPPQEELSHFDDALQTAISSLLPSHSSHRDLALTVLQHMAHLSDLASCVATSWPEFCTLLRHAAELLASVLPPGDTGARHVLIGSLAKIAERWNEEAQWSTVGIAGIVGSVFDEMLQCRRTVDKRLGDSVATWLCAYFRGRQGGLGNAVRILTLRVSTAVLAALEYALVADANLEIHLYVLSSLEHGVPPPPLYSRLHITTYFSSAVGTVSQSVDVLLLEFSCVGADGDMQCQSGALGTAACVKTLSPSARIIGFGREESIASAALGRRTAGEDFGGIEETHESVPGKFVNVYVTETGSMKGEDLERFAGEARKLDQHIFGETST